MKVFLISTFTVAILSSTGVCDEVAPPPRPKVVGILKNAPAKNAKGENNQKNDGQKNQKDDGQQNQYDNGQRNQNDNGQQNPKNDGQKNQKNNGQKKPVIPG